MADILPISKYLTLISQTRVLDKRTGQVIDITNPIVKDESFLLKDTNALLSIDERADVVYGLDTAYISFGLKTSDGAIPTINGFLIEVFSSGSNGKLKRMYEEDVEDPIDDSQTISDGFSNFLKIEVI